MNRLLLGCKLFWLGINQSDMFSKHLFVPMSKLFESALVTITTNTPHVTHMMIGEKRVVSFWLYPGLSKNPVDRITELVEEIDALKEIIERNKEGGIV